MTAQIDNANDDYAAKLAKLLPAEGTAALLAINRIIPDSNSDNALWVEIAAGVIAVFVILWAWQIRGIRSPWQIGFLFVGYLIWASSILWERVTPSFEGLDNLGFLPAVLAILFTLFIPFAFPARPTTP